MTVMIRNRTNRPFGFSESQFTIVAAAGLLAPVNQGREPQLVTKPNQANGKEILP